MRALQQCAVDNINVVPEPSRAEAARDCIMSSFYVDDLMKSVDTAKEAIVLCKDTDAILRAGCFNLRKWNSNSAAVISELSGERNVEEELLFLACGGIPSRMCSRIRLPSIHQILSRPRQR